MPKRPTFSPANTLVVLDFETSGLSPNQGARAIEIGAVLIENGVITQRFSELMDLALGSALLLKTTQGSATKC